MCLLFLAYKLNPSYPLVIAANRDEFYDRPSAAASFWKDEPDVLAGRDLKEGGTWLGITKKGKIAAVTNFRDLKAVKNNAPSRGCLVSDYLCGPEGPEEYLRNLRERADRYSGFNIVMGDRAGLYYFSNLGGEILKISPGVHGLSNHFLDTPWPKVEKGMKRLSRLISENDNPPFDAMFDVLSDTERPDDDLLPDTGVGLELERVLSSVFVKTEGYGTRSSTVILIDRNGKAAFAERVFDSGPRKFEENRFQFVISY